MSANANAIQPRQINVPLVVVGAIVVIASFAATVLIGQLAGRTTTAVPGATQPVLVAARDVAARTVLVAGDLAVAHYAVADVPPAALATAGAAVGLVAQTPLKKGQPVLSNQIGKDAGSGALSAYLPLAPGIVALTVPSDEQHGVGGYVQAGDYIDIVAVVTAEERADGKRADHLQQHPGDPGRPAAITSGPAAGAQQTGGTTTSSPSPSPSARPSSSTGSSPTHSSATRSSPTRTTRRPPPPPTRTVPRRAPPPASSKRTSGATGRGWTDLSPTILLALIAAAGALAVFWALRPALFPTPGPTAVDDRFSTTAPT